MAQDPYREGVSLVFSNSYGNKARALSLDRVLLLALAPLPIDAQFWSPKGLFYPVALLILGRFANRVWRLFA